MGGVSKLIRIFVDFISETPLIHFRGTKKLGNKLSKKWYVVSCVEIT